MVKNTQKKQSILDVAQKEVEEIQSKFDRHVLTEGERYNKVKQSIRQDGRNIFLYRFRLDNYKINSDY